MSKAEEYRQHAQQCLDTGQRIQNAEQRAMMLNIAQTWMRLAEEEDPPSAAAQQQQQAQPKDDKKE